MKDRWIRRFVPSMPTVARWPAVPALLDAADGVLRRYDARYAELPPASLRLRIGVDNRVLRNAHVWADADRYVSRLVERGWVADGGRVLELGAGLGRNALALRRCAPYAAYDGIDVDEAMVRWCTDHLGDDRSRFHHADVRSAVYNPSGGPAAAYRFPLADGSVSTVLALSVFSHLLWDDTAHYVAELERVSDTAATAVLTFFLIDDIAPRLGGRWSFAHEVGPCRVQSLRYPEAAVAYREDDVAGLLARHGFEIADVLDRSGPQQTVIARRG